MNKYDIYRECLQKEIDNMMEHKVKDIKSLEMLHCLFDMTSHLWERSKKYEEMVSNGEIKKEQKEWVDIVPDSHVDERMFAMLEHFKMYKDYKTMFRKTKNEQDKQMMLSSLGNIIKEHELIVQEVMSCGLDCVEEKKYIKDFLQSTYSKLS